MASTTMSATDRAVLRELGMLVAEVAADPVMDVRRAHHARVEALQPGKPTVHIYQVPWHEMNVDDELTLRCEDPWARQLENGLRMNLYQQAHMPGDHVVEAAITQQKCYDDTGFGISEDVDIVRTDDTSDVVSRHFNIQIATEADVEKIQFSRITPRPEQTEELLQRKHEIFDGVLPVREVGVGGFWFAPWDELVRWTGVQEVLEDMIDRPEYVHLLMDRFVSAWLHRLVQIEAYGLLDQPRSEMWAIGAAQIFSEVSPAMHEEFALEHEKRWFTQFGKSYYGCCEPLHHKVGIVKKHLPNLKKISMSPWIDFPTGVRNVGSDIIFAWKPNPAVLAVDHWDPDDIRRDMREKLTLARDGGCIVEIHMKDISTVRYQPHRLWEWAQIAKEVTEEFG